MKRVKLKVMIGEADYGTFNVSSLAPYVSEYLEKRYGMRFEKGHVSSLLTLASLLYVSKRNASGQADVEESLNEAFEILWNYEDPIGEVLKEIAIEEIIESWNNALVRNDKLPKLTRGSLRVKGNKEQKEKFEELLEEIAKFLKEEIVNINENSKNDFMSTMLLAMMRAGESDEEVSVKIG